MPVASSVRNPDGRLCFERARLYRLRKNSRWAAVLKGHGFNRAASAAISTRALAPEGCFSQPEHANSTFFRNLFGRAATKPKKRFWALAPEGSLFYEFIQSAATGK
jgi:hypothetical protein